jgi:hypothetical protein
MFFRSPGRDTPDFRLMWLHLLGYVDQRRDEAREAFELDREEAYKDVLKTMDQLARGEVPAIPE